MGQMGQMMPPLYIVRRVCESFWICPKEFGTNLGQMEQVWPLFVWL